MVESSFPQTQSPPDKCTTCGCSECCNLDVAFRGREWNEIPDSVIEYEHGSLPLLSDEAFRYFLPAYLHRSIRDDADKTAVPEFLLYALAPDSFNLPRFGGLTPSQVTTVHRYLEYYLADVKDDPDIQETVEYWSSLVEQR